MYARQETFLISFMGRVFHTSRAAAKSAAAAPAADTALAAADKSKDQKSS
jgi:hypothetical protein